MPRRRAEWFYGQRAYPLPFTPPGVRLEALEQMDRMAERGSAFVAATSSGQWKLIGPQPTNLRGISSLSGRVTALAVDPRNANVVYLGAAQGGVWKTTDGGLHWSPLTDTQPSLAVGAITLDPSNPDVIYVGTGESNFSGIVDVNPSHVPFIYSYFGAGILKSTDSGNTWTNLPQARRRHAIGPGASTLAGPFSTLIGGATIGALAVNPSSSQIVLAGVQIFSTGSTSGIYRSTDGGASWTNVLSGGAGTDVFFDAVNPNVAYAALGSGVLNDRSNGVYISADAGRTWTTINGTGAKSLPSHSVGRISLALAPSNPKTLYAALVDEHNGTSLGLFKTSDAGKNWSALPAPSYCAECDYANVIRVDPTDANVVFVGGLRLFRSTDGGTSWTDVNPGGLEEDETWGEFVHVDFHALAFASSGSKLYVGSDGGVWSTSQVNNVTWTNLNSSLAITQFYPGLSIDPTNVNHGFGGTQDNGLQRYSGNLLWDTAGSSDAGWTAIDFSNPNIVYLSSPAGILKSDANGNPGSFTSPMAGINLDDRVQFIPPLVMDPANSETLYFGTFRVYQTINGGTSWTPISSDLTAGGRGHVINTIAVAPSNSNTVYVGTSDGKVQVSTNVGVGSVWSDRGAGLPPRSITQIAVDALHEHIAYVTFSGFSGFADTLGHVFKTSNGGIAWADISGNLPNTPVNDIVVDPDMPNTLYVATDIGVFSSSDSGMSWFKLGSGMPRTAVTGLTLHRPSRTLRAGTYGRSVWDLALPQVSTRKNKDSH